MATTTLKIVSEGGWVTITASEGGSNVVVDGRTVPLALRTLADVIEAAGR